MLKMSELQLQNYRNMYNEGKLFSTIDIAFMLAHIDAIEQEKQRLIDNLGELQKQRYQAGLEAETKKVSLPKEVAEAIDYERLNFYDSGMMNNILRRSTSTGVVIESWMRNGIYKERFECLLSALVNGYTVEEPPTMEERIEEKLYEQLIFHEIHSPIDVSKLAHNLTLAVREALAEDKQHELG